ncbi:MAG TPA: hypothetical protein VKA15_04155, partial [Isosphaeraceae bacterium]|nr:hypothetical protein [Isosphaeraceae bacterium]
MPAEILGKPQPTPHPDLASKPGKIRVDIPAPPGEPQPIEQVDPDDPTYDSCLDDLNLVLSQPIAEPDPVLKSKSSTDDGSHSPPENVPVPPVVQDPDKQPSTGELFKTLGALANEVVPRAARARAVLFSALKSILPRPKGAHGSDPARRGRSGKVLASPDEGGDSAARDDDQLAESRLTWFCL